MVIHRTQSWWGAGVRSGEAPAKKKLYYMHYTAYCVSHAIVFYRTSVSILTCDIDIGILSVHNIAVLDENSLTYCHSFFTVDLGVAAVLSRLGCSKSSQIVSIPSHCRIVSHKSPQNIRTWVATWAQFFGLFCSAIWLAENNAINSVPTKSKLLRQH